MSAELLVNGSACYRGAWPPPPGIMPEEVRGLMLEALSTLPGTASDGTRRVSVTYVLSITPDEPGDSDAPADSSGA